MKKRRGMKKKRAIAAADLRRNGIRRTTGDGKRELTADEVMLNPEYLRKLREEEAHKSALVKPPTKEEMDEMFKDRDILELMMTFYGNPKTGFSARPTFSMKEVIDRQGRRRMVPFFGIQGTF